MEVPDGASISALGVEGVLVRKRQPMAGEPTAAGITAASAISQWPALAVRMTCDDEAACRRQASFSQRYSDACR